MFLSTLLVIAIIVAVIFLGLSIFLFLATFATFTTTPPYEVEHRRTLKKQLLGLLVMNLTFAIIGLAALRYLVIR